MRNRSQHSSDREQRLQEALVACIETAENGRAEDRDMLLARYPEFAAELRDFFAGRSNVERLAQPLRAHPPAGGADAPTTGLSDAAATSPGTKIGYFGDYELLEEIGRDGMAVVYKARQVSLNRVVAFGPDGKRLASGSDDATVRIWDATTGQETLTLRAKHRSVRSVAFSPDGHRLVATGAALNIWDATPRE